MRAQAVTAASAQRSAVSALVEVQDQLNNIGLLWAWQFCSDRPIAICTDLLASATIPEALSSLGGLNNGRSSAIATYAPTGSAGEGVQTGTSSRLRMSTTALVAVVLGSVFGGTVVIGLVVGTLAKRKRLQKMEQGISSR